MDPRACDTLVLQIRKPAFFGHEEEIGDMIRENSVDLFRH